MSSDPPRREGEGALIVTAELPADLQARATALRRAHYPPERNQVAAHITLFHALPPSSEAEVRARLTAATARLAPVPARLEGAVSLGHGVALAIASPAMLALRDELALFFHGLLGHQDQHRPRLHATVQNKVSAAEARALLARLRSEIEPRAFAFRGLGLHRYLGGPWETLRRYPFRG